MDIMKVKINVIAVGVIGMYLGSVGLENFRVHWEPESRDLDSHA